MTKKKSVKKPIQKRNTKTKIKTEKDTRGRKEKYNDKIHPEIAKRLASVGWTDKSIGDALGFTEPTFIKYKKEHPEFLKALQEGKENPDNQIRNIIFRSAKGYNYIEKLEERVWDAKNKKFRMVITRIYHKYMPPNAGSLAMYAYNKLKDEYKKSETIDANIKTDYVIKEPIWDNTTKKKIKGDK